jgi:hypothetical protein
MKRRYKALIAIVVPIIIVTLLKYTHDASYKWLMGYMIAVALVFKTSIISLWLAAQLHFMSFLTSLTLFQGTVLLVKRWLLDSVLANWVQTHIIENFSDAFKEAKEFYLRQDLKTKFRNIFVFIFGITLSGWILYAVGLLDNIVLFAELRLFIAGLFATIVTFVSKIAAWALSLLAISWLGPLLEVFALSFIFVRLEKWFGPNNFLSRFFNFLGDKINQLLYTLGILKERHIDRILLEPMVEKSKQMGTNLSHKIQRKKIEEEFRYFQSFENIIMQGHIDAYYSFKGMDKITNKKELYTRINKKTSNNIDIVAYVSRDGEGNLLTKSSISNFYNDVFLLESYASHKEHGVKVYDEVADEKHITHHDFWVLNTSSYPVTLRSNTHNFEDIRVEGNGLKLIKTAHPFCYKQGDVFCEFKGVRVATTFVERV